MSAPKPRILISSTARFHSALLYPFDVRLAPAHSKKYIIKLEPISVVFLYPYSVHYKQGIYIYCLGSGATSYELSIKCIQLGSIANKDIMQLSSFPVKSKSSSLSHNKGMGFISNSCIILLMALTITGVVG